PLLFEDCNHVSRPNLSAERLGGDTNRFSLVGLARCTVTRSGCSTSRRLLLAAAFLGAALFSTVVFDFAGESQTDLGSFRFQALNDRFRAGIRVFAHVTAYRVALARARFCCFLRHLVSLDSGNRLCPT